MWVHRAEKVMPILLHLAGPGVIDTLEPTSNSLALSGVVLFRFRCDATDINLADHATRHMHVQVPAWFGPAASSM